MPAGKPVLQCSHQAWHSVAACKRKAHSTCPAGQGELSFARTTLKACVPVDRVGVRISRAIIQSCNDCGTPVADADFPSGDEHGRLYKVWGTDRCGVHRAQNQTLSSLSCIRVPVREVATVDGGNN